eukprot:368093-Amphidinium_carterae.1
METTSETSVLACDHCFPPKRQATKQPKSCVQSKERNPKPYARHLRQFCRAQNHGANTNTSTNLAYDELEKH